MLVAEAVGRALAREGVGAVFGVLGSGNLVVTNALRDAGVPFVAARHEGGAICMADGYARVSGELAACSVHQGPGLTNAVTGLTEAAKSRTPLLVLAADTPAAALRSNFRIDQAALVEAVGAVAERVHGAATATADVARAARRARIERRAVVLMLPLDVQAEAVPEGVPELPAAPRIAPPHPAADAVAQLAALLGAAERPAIVAGRGAVLAGAGPALRALGERSGAVLATSAVANGLFRGDPFDVGIAGGFSSPLAARLLRESDAGRRVRRGAEPVDHAPRRRWSHPTRASRRSTSTPPRSARTGPWTSPWSATRPPPRRRCSTRWSRARPGGARPRSRRRSPRGGWRDEPYAESTAAGRIDPRTLSIALDDLLPEERTVVVDSGHFMGWPSMYLRVPDAAGFVFPQAFQCVGLGLGNAIGAALARPDRLTVAALGDGGALMALPELETLGRLGLPLLVVVYDDDAYGAEVHHFRPLGHAVDLAQFPPADLAALAEAAGCRGLTVHGVADLDGVRDWLERRDGPLVVDAKVDPDLCADWLEEAFRGH